ncbi:hypothetical protein [Halomonas sp. DN3]|uniref:hypothetical protein n=1 Tax=Halomonas sp. DN3 TaxID=2953657 RepID=UPI00209F387D|nr:hypothetical protein [Halomonas sp. DN3]USZ49698.1 hypothetical protein NKF27_19805 [Halomonas sp. DN3]
MTWASFAGIATAWSLPPPCRYHRLVATTAAADGHRQRLAMRGQTTKWLADQSTLHKL